MSERGGPTRLAMLGAIFLVFTQAATAGQPYTRTTLRYDSDYPVVDYGGPATENAIERLQTRLDKGEIKLEHQDPGGYLQALLDALKIDASSQVLVYSKTSLQTSVIKAATPRAIYFNDETYVGWVQGSNLLEFTTMDDSRGPVFYSMVNNAEKPQVFDRELSRCLACHDTFSMAGGGVPRFLVMSSPVRTDGTPLPIINPEETTDSTPIRNRWAGWYVTGRHANQEHLGNILVDEKQSDINVEQLRRGNLDSVAGLFDTGPYLRDTSDIVALLVLEHQLTVQNLITRASFKSRTLLERDYRAEHEKWKRWSDTPPAARDALLPMLEPLVRAMLMVDAAPLAGQVTSSSGFDTAFARRGPRDSKGRSLRDLDLTTRIFRYPLSYLVYSSAFDALPPCAIDYIYGRFLEVLTGQDTGRAFAHLSAADRSAALAILTETKPAFARVAASRLASR